MAEYKSIHKGQEIDEAVTRALNLSVNLGVRSDKMMSQKAITQELEKKIDKIEGKDLSSNDFTDELREKLINVNKTYLISIEKIWNKISDNTYTQIIPVTGIKEKDVAIVNVELSDDLNIADLELKAWSKISSISINNGSITVYCKNGTPDIDLKIKIKT